MPSGHPEGRPPIICQLWQKGPEPVSYTHLDVYKRQVDAVWEDNQLGLCVRITHEDGYQSMYAGLSSADYVLSLIHISRPGFSHPHTASSSAPRRTHG